MYEMNNIVRVACFASQQYIIVIFYHILLQMSLGLFEFEGENLTIRIEDKLHNIAFPNDTPGIDIIKALTNSGKGFLFLPELSRCMHSGIFFPTPK